MSVPVTSATLSPSWSGGTRATARTSALGIVAFVLAHAVLAAAIRMAPVIGTLHALACLVIGVAVAARNRPHQVAYVVAYIAGAEVLWRMTRVGLFWEYGKYAIAVVLVVALARVRPRRNVKLAVAYFVLLLPSAALTLATLDADLARQQLSFNLSGPLVLMLSVLVFSSLRLTHEQLSRAFYALLGPAVGIATIAYLSTAAAGTIEFTRQSNTITSGGFGPNQVSAILGLGMLFALLLVLERRQHLRTRIPLIVLAVVLAAQAALTFSRGGLLMGFLSAFVAMFYLVRDARTRATLVVIAALLFAVGRYAVVPRLEEFTQGKLSERYTSTKTSNRTTLASNDLQMFADNPVLGVGPGVGATLRTEIGVSTAAHTEFTRALAEHGILGALSLLLLAMLGFRTARTARTLEARAFVLALWCWFCLFLLINAMRIAAPSVLVGLACSIALSSLPRKPATPGLPGRP